MKRSWFAVCLFACLLVGAAGAQATLTVSAPPDRLALPGDFVTLVFRVTSSVSGTATLDVTSEHGYTLLTPPRTLELQAGVPGMVPVTVEVPADAPALTVDEVMVTMTWFGRNVQGSTHVTVGEKRGLAIQAPSQVSISDGKIPFTVINQGNVEERTTLNLTHDGTPIPSIDLVLRPGERRSVPVAVDMSGSYVATLNQDGIRQARAFVQVVREGVPPPPPFELHAVFNGSVSTDLDWTFGVKLDGALSDYVRTDAAVRLDRLAASFLSLSADAWEATVGNLGVSGLGLRLPGEVGLRAMYLSGPWSFGMAATSVSGGRYSGYGFGLWQDSNRVLGGAVGMHSGTPLASLAANIHGVRSRWSAWAQLLDRGLSASLRASERSEVTSSTASFSVQANDLFLPHGQLTTSASYSDSDATLYGSLTAPIGPDAPWRARGGAVLRLPWRLPGDLFLGMQGGTDESYVHLVYSSVSRSGWQTADQVGVTSDTNGFGVGTKLSVTYVAARQSNLGGDIDLTYYPGSGRTTGRASARYASALGPASLSVGSTWDLASSTLSAGGTLTWNDSPWQLEGTANASYDTALGTLSAALGLSAHVDIDVEVPGAIVDAAGGRRLGTLRGRLHAGAKGVAGVEIHVGHYTVRTGPDGTFSVQLPPGPVHVALDLASLPVQYQTVGKLDRTIEVVAKQSARVDFPVEESAGIRGVVLFDADGDGQPDSPARPAGGTVTLHAANGGSQTKAVDQNGGFAWRGLLPGKATVVLSNLPLGQQAEGAPIQTITLRAGDVKQVVFLVRPASASATVFEAQHLRIRKIQVEAVTVPPGAAPLITVEVQGQASSVSLESGKTRHSLTLENGTWTGRIPIPLDTAAGVFPYVVAAQSGSTTATRQGQLMVDESADAVTVSVSGQTVAGGSLTVDLEVLLNARSVSVQLPFTGAVPAVVRSPGHWQARVRLPPTTGTGRYALSYAVIADDGRRLTGSQQLKIVGE